jgi:hypothetical protein
MKILISIMLLITTNIYAQKYYPLGTDHTYTKEEELLIKRYENEIMPFTMEWAKGCITEPDKSGHSNRGLERMNSNPARK